MIIPVTRGSSREAHYRETLPETLPLGMRAPLSPLLSPSKSPRAAQPARPGGTRSLMRRRATGQYLPLLLGLFAVLNIGDLASTYLGLASGMREGNPLKLWAPSEPGEYEIRYILGRGTKVLARTTISIQRSQSWVDCA